MLILWPRTLIMAKKSLYGLIWLLKYVCTLIPYFWWNGGLTKDGVHVGCLRKERYSMWVVLWWDWHMLQSQRNKNFSFCGKICQLATLLLLHNLTACCSQSIDDNIMCGPSFIISLNKYKGEQWSIYVRQQSKLTHAEIAKKESSTTLSLSNPCAHWNMESTFLAYWQNLIL